MLENKNKFLMILLLSVMASLIIWTLMSGKVNFAVAIVVSVLVHEYGHYYWMGRVGIKKKTMFMLPPFGAVAVANELPPNRKSEADFVIAGPAFGLITSVLFVVLYVVFGNTALLAAAYLSAVINTFNLLPIVPLDGGRIVFACLFSINRKLARVFLCHLSGFMILVCLFKLPSLLWLVIMFIWYKEVNNFLFVERQMNFYIQNGLLEQMLKDTSDADSFPNQKKEFRKVQDVIHFFLMPSMTVSEIKKRILLTLGILVCHLSIALWVSSKLDLGIYLFEIGKYF